MHLNTPCKFLLDCLICFGPWNLIRYFQDCLLALSILAAPRLLCWLLFLPLVLFLWLDNLIHSKLAMRIRCCLELVATLLVVWSKLVEWLKCHWKYVFKAVQFLAHDLKTVATRFTASHECECLVSNAAILMVREWLLWPFKCCFPWFVWTMIVLSSHTIGPENQV